MAVKNAIRRTDTVLLGSLNPGLDFYLKSDGLLLERVTGTGGDFDGLLRLRAGIGEPSEVRALPGALQQCPRLLHAVACAALRFLLAGCGSGLVLKPPSGHRSTDQQQQHDRGQGEHRHPTTFGTARFGR
jgi:hypothetical protein